MKIWKKNNKIIVDDKGRLVLCDVCPCSKPCPIIRNSGPDPLTQFSWGSKNGGILYSFKDKDPQAWQEVIDSTFCLYVEPAAYSCALRVIVFTDAWEMLWNSQYQTFISTPFSGDDWGGILGSNPPVFTRYAELLQSRMAEGWCPLYTQEDYEEQVQAQDAISPSCTACMTSAEQPFSGVPGNILFDSGLTTEGVLHCFQVPENTEYFFGIMVVAGPCFISTWEQDVVENWLDASRSTLPCFYRFELNCVGKCEKCVPHIAGDGTEGSDSTDASDGSDSTDGTDTSDTTDIITDEITDSTDSSDTTDGSDTTDTSDTTDSTDATDATDSTDTDGTDASDTTDATDSTDSTDTSDTTDATDATDSTDGSDGADATDSTDSSNSTDGTDSTDSTDSTDTSDTTDATDATDSTDTDGTDATDGSDTTDGTDSTDSTDSTDTSDTTDATDTTDGTGSGNWYVVKVSYWAYGGIGQYFEVAEILPPDDETYPNTNGAANFRCNELVSSHASQAEAQATADALEGFGTSWPNYCNFTMEQRIKLRDGLNTCYDGNYQTWDNCTGEELDPPGIWVGAFDFITALDCCGDDPCIKNAARDACLAACAEDDYECMDWCFEEYPECM